MTKPLSKSPAGESAELAKARSGSSASCRSPWASKPRLPGSGWFPPPHLRQTLRRSEMFPAAVQSG